MNKTLYQFCQRNFKNSKTGKIKLGVTAKLLNKEYEFGNIQGNNLYFNEQDIDLLIKRISTENNLHVFRDEYSEPQNKHNNAETNRNEKNNSISTRSEYVLVNALHTININNRKSAVLGARSLGVHVAFDEIKTIEHPQLILVENLIIMAHLNELMIPTELKNALWLYRGDTKVECKTGPAYSFFRSWKGKIKLICFPDLDPAGINIARSSGADEWLTAVDPSVVSLALSGIENEYFGQENDRIHLDKQLNLPSQCQKAYAAMCRIQKTLKQEHLVKHNIQLGCFSLTEKERS